MTTSFTEETYKGYEFCILFEYRSWAAYRGNPSFYDVLSIYLDCYPKAIKESMNQEFID